MPKAIFIGARAFLRGGLSRYIIISLSADNTKRYQIEMKERKQKSSWRIQRKGYLLMQD